MLKIAIADPIDKTGLHTEEMYGRTFEAAESTSRMLIVASPLQAHGIFKAVVLTGAATTPIAMPLPGGSIIITDLIISAKKVASTTLTIRFSDGSNTEIILDPDTINQSTNFAWSPNGRIQGWEDAALEVVTTGANTDATVTAGYMKLEKSITYLEWDAFR